MLRGACDSNKQGKPIKLFSLNLLNYVAPPHAAYEFDNILDAQQWQQKQAWLGRLIAQAEPDVMAFQEVFSAEALALQCQQLGYPYFLATPSALDEASHVYRKPGLALASKYPLRQVSWYRPAVAAQFSRQPLVARLKLPGLAWVKCYVLHLKSKRAMVDDLPEPISASDEYLGRWQADQLRAKEVRLLLQDIVRCRRVQAEPVVVMGDFNDDLAAGALADLLAPPLPGPSNKDRAWRLHDGFALSPPAGPRPPSHYWGGQGNVLDYILLSGEFSPDYSPQIAEVLRYQCFDRHLTHADFALDSQASDHAAVMLELRPL